MKRRFKGDKMKTIEYRTVDKSGWGAGPWMDEPDKRQWVTMAGLPALIVRNRRSGSLCGYVGVTTGHPSFENSEEDYDVHGGVTFSGFCRAGDESETICHIVEPGEDDKTWWIGFDCYHWNDMAPGDVARNKEQGWPSMEPRAIYRPFEYVEKQCEGLAQRLTEKGVPHE